MPKKTVKPAIHPSAPAWQPDDSRILRDFFLTNVGQRFLRTLEARRPEASERKDGAVLTLQCAARSGYEECIADVLSLANPADEVD